MYFIYLKKILNKGIFIFISSVFNCFILCLKKKTVSFDILQNSIKCSYFLNYTEEILESLYIINVYYMYKMRPYIG